MLKPARWQGAAGLLLLVLIAGCSWWWFQHQLVEASPTVNSPASPAPAVPQPEPLEYLADVERSLLVASQAMVEGRLTDAETILMELIRQEPRFRLAHALLADIHRVRGGLGPVTLNADDVHPSRQSLLEEWRRRLNAPAQLPPPGRWPTGLITFSPFSPHAFVVDASTSRLYWLQRTDGTSAPKLKGSFYISVGKAGVGKEVEGDNKTPLGIYQITARRLSADLPAFYGAGALVLDYPNPVDRTLQRTGSGIWLHGSPPDTYTRDPLASEGCVVLSNADMRQLLELPDLIHSPVLIVREVRWIDEATHRRQRDEALALAREWMRTAIGIDPDLHALGVQRWTEKDGQRYWRLEYRVADPTQPRMSWFLREADDGLKHLAGPLPADNKARESHSRDLPVKEKTNADDHRKQETARGVTSANDRLQISRDAVLQAVHGWAKAWSARDVPRYLAHYHVSFQPEDGLSRQAWKIQRRQRIEDKRRIVVDVLQPRVRLDGPRATVTFTQRYQADGQRELRVRKTLVLQQDEGRWLIVEERTR